MSDEMKPTAPDRLFAGLPEALPLPFPIAPQPGPIELYNGPLHVTHNGTGYAGDGRIELAWLPFRRIRFAVSAELTAFDVLLPALGSVHLHLGCDATAPKVQGALTGVATSSDATSQLTGILDKRNATLADGPARYAMFVVPNLTTVHGRPVRHPEGSVTFSRCLLGGSGWAITLDATPDEQEVSATLKASAGYGVTHVGRIERTDGAPFTAADAAPVLEAIGWYLSFAAGRWVGPCLPTGFDAAGVRLWQRWHHARVEPCHNRRTWLGDDTAQLEKPFPGFLSRWLDADWQDVVRFAIHWFVEANGSAGSIEGSIVLTQTAFELLASAVLIEQCGWLSTEGYDKLPAADRIRLLFRWASIPTDIPPEAAKLAQHAKADNWEDIPTAMTAVRNTITHPTKKNREKFGRHLPAVRHDIYRLGLWALELCLLRLFDYNGTYFDRIRTKYAGDATQMPWACPST